MEVGVTGRHSIAVSADLKLGVALRQEQKGPGPGLHPQGAFIIHKETGRETAGVTLVDSNLLANGPAQMEQTSSRLHPQRAVCVLDELPLPASWSASPVWKCRQTSVFPEEKSGSLRG